VDWQFNAWGGLNGGLYFPWDQDDLIAAAGANGFSPPAAIRADQIFVRGVRLPFLKFPRSPNL